MSIFLEIVYLPPTPVPPRSVVIKRFAPAPEKPRNDHVFHVCCVFYRTCHLGDIIIERWLPYAPQPQRQTIVRSAPPLLAYPEPQNKIEIYETVRVQIIRKFKKLDPVRENPRDYAAHYGGSLLDSTAIVQEARKAGVYEDLVKRILFFSLFEFKNFQTMSSHSFLVGSRTMIWVL